MYAFLRAMRLLAMVRASVTVGSDIVGSIGRGLLVYLGAAQGDWISLGNEHRARTAQSAA